MTGLVRIHLPIGRGPAAVYSPPWAGPTIKAASRRRARWDPEAKCWRIPTDLAGRVRYALEKAGFTVRVITPGRPSPPVVLPHFGPMRGADW